MLRYYITTVILSFGAFFARPAAAQDIDIGVFGGGSYYLGELNPGNQFLFTRPAYGGLIRFNFDTRWAMRMQVLQGQIAGDDAVSGANTLRNLRFTSPLTELSGVVEFNFLDYFTGSMNNYFSPYLFGGPGFFIFNPKADYDGETINLRDITTEGQTNNGKYSLYGLSAVFGFGMKYSLNNRFGLGLEWGMRKTFTDYLDDVSTTYYLDFNQLNPDQIGAPEVLSDPSPVKHLPGMQRGDPHNNDWYSFAGLTLTYRFTIGEKSTCSDFENVKNK